MKTASALRRTNIAEHLLYMWQVEDLIRANGLDLDRLRQTVISRIPDLTDDDRRSLEGWYESLIDMMRREDVEKSGHLQINRNILSRLAELHQQLLADPKEQEYSRLFYQALPVIVELRAKGGDTPAGEVETCFNALYGLLMLRLGGKAVSEATSAAMAHISALIALLAKKFHDEENAEQAAFE